MPVLGFWEMALACALMAAVLVGCQGPSSGVDEPVLVADAWDESHVVSSNTYAAQAAQVVALTNSYREANSVAPLAANAELMVSAQKFAEDMANQGFFSHTGADGSSPGERMRDAGYNWSTYGENIAYGYGTPEQVMEGWINSSGHRANIMNSDFKDIGVGYYVRPSTGTAYWVQNFGRR